jgi:hypothetical protein
MVAALTYARRYALFTLVGIAGEGDLDARDLNLKVEPTSRQRMKKGGGGNASAVFWLQTVPGHEAFDPLVPAVAFELFADGRDSFDGCGVGGGRRRDSHQPASVSDG